MREAAARLANRNRLGRDVFARGAPEPVEIVRKSEYSATLYDLLTAYAVRRQEMSIAVVHMKRREVWSLNEAREVLEPPGRPDRRLDAAPRLPVALSHAPEMRTSVTASAFGASLELVREGRIQLRQTEPFAPLYIRDRVTVAPVSSPSPEAGHG